MKQYLPAGICACGKIHTASVREVITGSGAALRIPDCIPLLDAKKPFLLADANTWKAAGAGVGRILSDAGISFSRHVFSGRVEPDETAVGSMCMHFDRSCDLIMGIGSGVINDLGKILSSLTGLPYIIVATAPSMDGYASATSSMAMDGLKVSLPSRCADIIVGDTQILKNAPMHMLSSGIGDMIAKYVSIAEWRIANIITGEYYCEEVASLIRQALRECVSHAEGLTRREEPAVEAVFEGLILGGLAMSYAGVSRPASGVEHYFSHIWDMRALVFHTPSDLHGIQCATAALMAVQLYDRIRQMRPDREKALRFVSQFDTDRWNDELRTFLGRSADTMIELEKKEKKYDKAAHALRLERIISSWDDILAVLDEELPSADELSALLRLLDIPTDPAYLGVDKDIARMTFRATKDIRDKYVLSRLAWDLGILDELV